MAYIMATYDQVPTQPAVQYGASAPALGATTELPKWVGTTLIVGVVVGIGYLIYKGLQQRASMYRTVAAKEGSRGVLRMQAGEAAIGLMSAGTTALLDRPRRNGRKVPATVRRTTRELLKYMATLPDGGFGDLAPAQSRKLARLAGRAAEARHRAMDRLDSKRRK